jgi:acyl carrier protein phosphodiesterase
MNYLAHAYLSFNNDAILVGNMISDFVKGNHRYTFPLAIQKGITLHRAIDEFTDNHAATKAAKQFLKPAAGLYAAVFIDIVYDHFLAKDSSIFSQETLKTFSGNVYNTLYNYEKELPQRFATLLVYMHRDNWLFNYGELYGIEQSFKGIERRAKYLESSKPAFEAFKKNYEALEECYKIFFPEVKQFAVNHFKAMQLED